MPSPVSLVWLRRDLRLADNPALAAAIDRGGPVLLVYILDDTVSPPLGGAARWWLHRSLTALNRESGALGCPLTLRRGSALDVLEDLCRTHEAGVVYWNRAYEPASIERDKTVKSALKARGVACESFNGCLLHEPWTVKTGDGGFYRVFTPFWKACLQLPQPPRPAAKPERINGVAADGDRLADWGLRSGNPDWAGGLRDCWTPGEEGAARIFKRFLDSIASRYAGERDKPGIEATSRLSPHLRFGEISPRQIWHAVRAHQHAYPETASSLDKFLSEVGWREFSYNLLFHFPDLPEQPLRSEFSALPWRRDEATFEAWRRGLTGYPIVDAGMRELWATGYMHNRVRMIAASFLTKDLMIPWQTGAAWFWDMLCDADLASNSAGWQWVAGCGADAAPYFRIFNPILQGEKFDPEGVYVRRWIPEISSVPDRYLHKPWLASESDLRQAGVTLGRTYPRPIIDHAEARNAALTAYQALKDGGSDE